MTFSAFRHTEKKYFFAERRVKFISKLNWNFASTLGGEPLKRRHRRIYSKAKLELSRPFREGGTECRKGFENLNFSRIINSSEKPYRLRLTAQPLPLQGKRIPNLALI